MLLTEEVEVIISNHNSKQLEALGYKIPKSKNCSRRLTADFGKKITIKVEHLSKGSHVEVEVQCDYCNKAIMKVAYKTYLKQKESNAISKDCCRECWPQKMKEVNIKKYGANYSPKAKKELQKKAIAKRKSIQDVRQAFIDVGLIPQFEDNEYQKRSSKLKCSCPKHPDKEIITTYDSVSSRRGCKYCSDEKRIAKTRLSEEFVFNKFIERGMFPIRGEQYVKSTEPIKYVCQIHYDVIQEKKYSDLSQGYECYYCGLRKGSDAYQWKGGITPIHEYLRKKIRSWKQESMKACGFKCVVTGESFHVIHHLYNFNDIARETFEETGIDVRPQIDEYSEEELTMLVDKCIEIHYRYPLGVCLTKKVHNLFHSIYGKENNTPDQFEEFRLRYLAGEFKKQKKSKEQDNEVPYRDLFEYLDYINQQESAVV